MTTPASSDVLRQLADTFRTHRLRTALTMFGIAWGIALSLVLGGLGDTLRDGFIAELERAGARAVFVVPGHARGEVGGYRAGRDVRFTARTSAVLRAQCPSLEQVSPQISVGWADVKTGNKVRAFPVEGVAPSIHRIRNLRTRAGRPLDADDVREARAVAFVGANVEARLFGDADPVGRSIRVKGHPFVVIGVAAPKGDALFRSGGYQDDDVVLIPSTTAERLFVADHDLATVYALQATSYDASYTLVDEVRRVLAPLHGFAADDPDALLFFNTVDNVRRVVQVEEGTRALTAIADLTTLFIGGIGLMNVLIVSVTERTREIGLRRALGATRASIMGQFLAESLALTIAAGTVGVALAFTLSLGMHALPLPALFSPPAIAPGRLALAVVSMITVGVAAGIVPARRAAALDPSIALRFE